MNRPNSLYAIIGVLVLAGFILIANVSCETAQPSNPERDSKAIKAALQRWTDAYNSQDWDRTLDIWEPSAVVISPNSPDQHFDEIRQAAALQKQERRSGEQTYRFEIEDAQIHGEIAYVIDSWWLTTKPLKGPSRTEKFRSLEVWHKNESGEWKVIRAVLYPEESTDKAGSM